MTLDEVTQAMEQQTPVIAKLRDANCPCFITGVISQYDKDKGWHYSLELQDRKARTVYRVALKDVEVERNLRDLEVRGDGKHFETIPKKQ